MSTLLAIVLAFVAGWMSRSVLVAVWSLRLSRRAAFHPTAHQVISSVRTRTRRAEEHMRRAAQGGQV